MNPIGGFGYFKGGVDDLFSGVQSSNLKQELNLASQANQALARQRGAQYLADATQRAASIDARSSMLNSAIGAIGTIGSSAVGSWIKQSQYDRGQGQSRDNSGSMDWGRTSSIPTRTYDSYRDTW